MARITGFRPNFEGIGRLRKSEQMDASLERRAEAIAQQASALYGALGHTVHAEVLQAGSDTSERSRVAVIALPPEYGMRVEFKHRVLGGSLDAARG